MKNFEHMPPSNKKKISDVNPVEEGEIADNETANEEERLNAEQQETNVNGVLAEMTERVEGQIQNLPEMVQGAIRRLLEFAKDEKTELGVKVIGELILLLPIAGIPGGIIKILKLLKEIKGG